MLKRNIDKFISIGYSCGPKIFLNEKKKEEYLVFDYIGTSMWAINLLINNDFEDFLSINNIKKMQINENTKIYTNEKYYIRFFHEIDIKMNELNKVYIQDLKEKYERRIARFNDLLNEYNTNNKILCFVRTQECVDGRIIYDEYKKYFEKSEYEHLCDFSTLIKTKYPTMKFIILYINYSENLVFDKNNNIVSFKKTKKQDTMVNFKILMENIFSKNIEYVNDCLSELYPN